MIEKQPAQEKSVQRLGSVCLCSKTYDLLLPLCQQYVTGPAGLQTLGVILPVPKGCGPILPGAQFLLTRDHGTVTLGPAKVWSFLSLLNPNLSLCTEILPMPGPKRACAGKRQSSLDNE